jgi:hypothetical protein
MALEPIELNPGTGGDTVAADDLGADGKAQVVKLAIGADGVNDGLVASGNPLPVTGTVTANAGTNLNTSTLALEAGGNLAACSTSLAIVDDWDESDRCKTNPIVGQAGVQGASGTVSANTQRVVLATDVALPAGTNNIGDVDVLTVPAPLSTTANGSAATALRVTVANDSTGQIAVASLPASTNTLEVVGDVAAGVTVAGNPVMGGFRADTTAPTAVTDGQAVYPFADEYGALYVKPSCNQISISATPTIDTAVYQSGDRLGSVMTFASAALVTGRSGTIVGALLFDDAASAFDIRLHIFKVSPTLTNADNGALAITDANLATAIPVGVIEFLSANGHSYVDNRICQGTWLGGPLAIPFVSSGSTSLFGVLEARGAYDAAATDDLVVTLTIIRD